MRTAKTIFTVLPLGDLTIVFSCLMRIQFQSSVLVQHTDCPFCNHGPRGIQIIVDREVAPMHESHAEGGSLVRISLAHSMDP